MLITQVFNFLSYSIDIYDKNIPYTIKFLAVRSELIGGQIKLLSKMQQILH